MRARNPAPHVARGRETLQMHGFPVQHVGILQSAITLRRELKFPAVKSETLQMHGFPVQTCGNTLKCHNSKA